jgi:cell division protein ZipA
MDLQSILIIAGSITILGVCIHGIYVSRKSSNPQKHWSKDDDLSTPTINVDSLDNKVEQPLDETSDFDQFGLGKTRVVTEANTDKSLADNPILGSTEGPSEADEYSHDVTQLSNQDIPSINDINDVVSTAQDNEQEGADNAAPLYASVVSNPKPQTKPIFNSVSDATEINPESTDSIAEYKAKAEEELGYSIPELPAEFKVKDSEENSVADNVAANIVADNEVSPKSEIASQATGTEAELHIPTTEEPPKYLTPEQVAAEEAAIRAAEDEAQKPSIAQAAINLVTGRKKRSVRKREPVVDTNQMGIDFDSIDPVINEAKAIADSQNRQDEPQVKKDIDPEFLAISLKVPKENPISGAQLLPALITLGMKYGENNIFHRHVNNNGKGPVVFSLANLFKPGVFDIDNMENESIRGLSLFMTLPTESDAHQVFNMMHNAARKLADEFNAEILDDNRSTLTKQGLQQYVERIRDFERRRLLG